MTVPLPLVASPKVERPCRRLPSGEAALNDPAVASPRHLQLKDGPWTWKLQRLGGEKKCFNSRSRISCQSHRLSPYTPARTRFTGVVCRMLTLFHTTSSAMPPSGSPVIFFPLLGSFHWLRYAMLLGAEVVNGQSNAYDITAPAARGCQDV